MIRKFVVLATLCFAIGGWAAADDRHEGRTVTIMTQNMDDGTDLTYIIGVLTNQFPATVGQAVDLTFAELNASDFEGRAALLAAKISEKKPVLVALQEAVLWRIGPSPDTATTVLYDNLAILLAALKKAGAPYTVVATNSLTDLALPGDQIGGALRFTDRNAILVRSDLHRPDFYLTNVHSQTFDAMFPFAGMSIPAGWISVDVHMGHEQFRFVTTHLQTPIQGIKEATKVQLAQAKELIHELRDVKIPVVICGDFNSDANHGGFVDDTKAVDHFPRAGYTEAWPATHSIGDPGLTWPYYLEDQFPAPPFFAPATPLERIDLFFSRDMKAVSSDLVLAPAVGMPPFASDHAGVIATFKP